jgi:predicted nuclease of predicted toxin-antitoxin system
VALLHRRGFEAAHVSHLGLSGTADHLVWREAFRRDAVFVTVNADDFLELAEDAELHAGLIIIRDGMLTAHEQAVWLENALSWLGRHPHDLVNHVLEVRGLTIEDLEVYPLPP